MTPEERDQFYEDIKLFPLHEQTTILLSILKDSVEEVRKLMINPLGINWKKKDKE